HVDFSGVADAAEAAGARQRGYTAQARFLINAGLIDALSQADPQDAAHYLPAANAVQKLVSEAEMGELFKVIAFARGFDAPLSAFASGDRSAAL
ncbi:MAG: class I SAM-dependent methyltransferase, partial [Janthinobacterium lividum]